MENRGIEPRLEGYSDDDGFRWVDTGNFQEHPYEPMERIAAHAVLVQAKTYFGGGTWYYPTTRRIRCG